MIVTKFKSSQQEKKNLIAKLAVESARRKGDEMIKEANLEPFLVKNKKSIKK